MQYIYVQIVPIIVMLIDQQIDMHVTFYTMHTHSIKLILQTDFKTLITVVLYIFSDFTDCV